MNKFYYALLSLCLMNSGSLALAQSGMAMDDMNKGAMSMEKKDKDSMDKGSMGNGSMKKEPMDNGMMKKDSMDNDKMNHKTHPMKLHKQKMKNETEQVSMQRIQ